MKTKLFSIYFPDTYSGKKKEILQRKTFMQSKHVNTFILDIMSLCTIIVLLNKRDFLYFVAIYAKCKYVNLRGMDYLVAITYVKSETFKFISFYYLPTNTFFRLPIINSAVLLAKKQLLFTTCL